MQASLPLQNISVVVTRPAHQNHAICHQLSKLGASVSAFPCIEIQPNEAIDLTALDTQLRNCHGLIFISSNAVNHLFSAIPSLPEIIANDCEIFAVGATTANTLHTFGIYRVLAPDKASDSEALLKLSALQEVQKKMILIIKGMGGRELIYDSLTARSADVHNIEIYQRCLPKSVDIAPLTSKIDLILFTSSETVNNFLVLTSDSLQESLLTCQTVVGHPRIAEKVTSLGFKKLPIIAASPSDADMLSAVQQWARMS